MIGGKDPTPRRDDLVFDVGLHRGQDTEFYLAKGFRVVAFEANPLLVAHCRERFDTAIAAGQLAIVEGAIVAPGSDSARSGRAAFWLNQSLDIWGTADSSWAERNARLGTQSTRIEVPAIDFAAALREHGVPHYMKVDIEGCDLVCLRALEEFHNRPLFVSMESDKTSLDAVRAELGLFELLGYRDFQIVEQSSIPRVQKEPIPALEGRLSGQAFERGCSGLFGRELPGRWLTLGEAVARYRWIRLGYRLLGDDGWLKRADWPGAAWLRKAFRAGLGMFTRAPVPGWYDTHARHRDAAQ